MTRFHRNIDHLALMLPIPSAAREAATTFAQSQPTAAKAATVRLNTLAVWATRDYCQMMDIPTALSESDSWNPLMQLVGDVADLQLPGVGQLECRPMPMGETECLVPPEVWDLRIGYVLVGISADEKTAQLHGFSPQAGTGILSLRQLQPLEALLDHLAGLRQQPAMTAAVTAAVNLSRWLGGWFDAGWLAVDALLPTDDMTPAISFRSGGESPIVAPEEGAIEGVSRAKLIDLAIRLGSQQVILLVDLQEEPTGKRHIGLQVHPPRQSPYLPAGVELAVFDAERKPFMQVQSREADNFIQLRLNGQPGERFLVQIRWQDATYVEDFMI